MQIKTLPPGKYNDGAGLWLHRRDDGGAQWFLRVTVHGRRREMGLGPVSEVGQKEARQAAEQWRSYVRQGKDPIKEREKERREAERNLHCLADVALDAFESRKAELKGDGKAGRWFSPLELHVLPKLGKVPVADISQIDIRDALRPIWHSKGETSPESTQSPQHRPQARCGSWLRRGFASHRESQGAIGQITARSAAYSGDAMG
jgi:hypothetical protein